MASLEAEVRSRGFHMAVIGTQVVVLCNQSGQINVIC